MTVKVGKKLVNEGMMWTEVGNKTMHLRVQSYNLLQKYPVIFKTSRPTQNLTAWGLQKLNKFAYFLPTFKLNTGLQQQSSMTIPHFLFLF